ncbi:hypothetical protein PMIN05_009746 [Paraphaeosphaeria minitans]
MVQPSHPQGSDPLATRIDIWPYIHKICIYLALEKAILYRKHMQLFEDGAIDEATLWSKTYDVGIFDYDLHTELTHVKLVVMINKANDKVQAPAAAEPTVSGIAPVRNSPERADIPALALSVRIQDDKTAAQFSHEVEHSSSSPCLRHLHPWRTFRQRQVSLRPRRRSQSRRTPVRAFSRRENGRLRDRSHPTASSTMKIQIDLGELSESD